jgi:hypothetical protein
MPKVAFSVPHELGQQEAHDRINGFLPKVQEYYKDQIKDLDQSWVDNVLNFGFKTMGMGVKGTVTVEESEVKFSQDLPFAAMMFKGKIEKQTREQLEKLLS